MTTYTTPTSHSHTYTANKYIYLFLLLLLLLLLGPVAGEGGSIVIVPVKILRLQTTNNNRKQSPSVIKILQKPEKSQNGEAHALHHRLPPTVHSYRSHRAGSGQEKRIDRYLMMNTDQLGASAPARPTIRFFAQPAT